MKKNNNKNKILERIDYKLLGSIFLVFIIFIVGLNICGYFFGSKIDWINQHTVIPEYFRSLFYKSKNLFPSFALNIGMGQNIYYLSYYGLFSPIILISYLFPHIPMYIYISFVSIFMFFISGLIIFRWFKKKYNRKIAFLATCIFMFNSVYSFHFHRHIMFVIYMPFLLLSLDAVDLYFEKKNPIYLIGMIVLLIFTSYYFSPSSLITIGIYTLYKIIDDDNKKINNLFNIIIYVLVAILISSILLIPTAYCLLSGRIDTSKVAFGLGTLFNPFTSYNYSYYFSYYSWGLSIVFIISIVFAFMTSKKSNKFLAVIASIYLLFPIVSFIYNGGMYVDGKVLLNFIPVFLILVCELFNDIERKKIDYLKLIKYLIPVFIYLVISGFLVLDKNNYSVILLVLDITFSLIGLYRIYKFNDKKVYYLTVLSIAFISFIVSYFSEGYISHDKIKELNNEDYYNLQLNYEDNLFRSSIMDNKVLNVNRIYNSDYYSSSIYSSSSNKHYFNFVRNVFQNEILNRDNLIISPSSNILFNIYSGTKYLIGTDVDLKGYELFDKVGNIGIYKNDNILPIGYSSNKIMSLEEFNSLKYPANIDALLHYVIIDKKLDYVYEKRYSEYMSGLSLKDSKNLIVSDHDGHTIIDARKGGEVNLELESPIIDKILIIRFNMNKAKEGYACESTIDINGIRNSLSCDKWKYNNNNNSFEYVISSNKPIDNINIKFSKDYFDISDFQMYTFDYDEIASLNKDIDTFHIDNKNTIDNKVIGLIDVKNDGFFKITIPYEDKGFSVKVDNKDVDVELVDTAFIGFPIAEGKHNIEITYNVPYLGLSRKLSICGIILYIFIVFKYYLINKN